MPAQPAVDDVVTALTGSNWEGVGVAPDVSVPADSALEKALELAAVGQNG